MKNYKPAFAAVLASLCILASGCGTNGSKTPSDSASAVSSAAEAAESIKEGSAESTESSGNASEEPSETDVLISDSIDNSTIKFELDNDKPYDTLEDYLESDSAKRMISRISGPDSEGIITTKVYAERGDRLVFERKISKDFNIRLEDDFLENAKKSVDEKEDVFVSLADQLETCINKKTIKIIVRYLDPDGSVIYERIFDNDRLPESSKDASDASAQPSGQTSGEASQNSSAQPSGQTSKEASKASA